MSIRPLEDRVLVKPEEPEEKTPSGIYLPDTAKDKPLTGQVVAVGPGKRSEDGQRTAPSVKEGQTVMYGKFAGTEIDVDGESHLLLRESELLATVEK